jgi:hypothetical protein
MRQNRKFDVDRANLLLDGNPDLPEIAIQAVVVTLLASCAHPRFRLSYRF